MDIKFLTQENESRKLYSKFGMVVPVGDLETGKAPAIQLLPAEATQTSVTFNFNVMSGADITAIEYKVNDGEAVSVTPKKGVVTVELSDLEYNSGPYEIELTVTNETGDTSVTQTADLVPYTDWATPEEVLDGNKFIGEDGQEAVGTYVPESGSAQNYLELQLGDPSPWEDQWQTKRPFGGYVLLNLNDLTIPEGGTVSGNTPADWVYDMEFIQCYLDAQHNNFFNVDCYTCNGILNDPRVLGNAFITANDTIIIPCSAGHYEYDADAGDQAIPQYDGIPCGQTNLTGDFEVYAITGEDPMGTGQIYEVVATGTYFIPATQAC